MNCSPPHSSLHGIFQVRILQWLAFPTPTTDRFLLNALIKVGSGWWLDGTAYFADMAGKFFIHIPPLSLQISFVWLHPLDSMGKKDLEMLVARVSLKHTDQGRKVDSKPGRAENI